MSDGLLFAGFLLLTVVLLVSAVATGLLALRRRHLTLVALMAVSLGVTIYFAEQLGESYDLDAAGWITPFHLTIAKLTTVGFLAPIVTGLHTLRHPGTRRLHGRIAYVLVAMTLATAASGVAMLTAAERL